MDKRNKQMKPSIRLFLPSAVVTEKTEKEFWATTVSDIFMYNSSLKVQHNRSDGIAKQLPLVFQQRLHDVVARDIQIKSLLVTFHGGASRTATKRHRLVTNWNLLSAISRGAIKIENNFTNFTISFWLGFPKSFFLLAALLFAGVSMFPAITIFLQGESLIEVILGVVIPIIVISFLAIRVGITISIMRFHWFVRSCINQAKREVEKQLLPL